MRPCSGIAAVTTAECARVHTGKGFGDGKHSESRVTGMGPVRGHDCSKEKSRQCVAIAIEGRVSQPTWQNKLTLPALQ